MNFLQRLFDVDTNQEYNSIPDNEAPTVGSHINLGTGEFTDSLDPFATPINENPWE